MHRPNCTPILELDSCTLRHIWDLCSPLDRRQLAACCKRFRDLTQSAHLLLVVGQPREVGAGLTSGAGRRYSSLEEAVVASRPGDSIFLEPGSHSCASVAIDHPLQISGGGEEAAATILQGAAPAKGVLTFRASCRLSNLTVRATQCACIVHPGPGSLRIQDCILHCEGQGLGGLLDLVSPLVTAYPLPTTPRQALLGCKLSVHSTRISGDRGMRAVRLFGAGALQSVRVIPGVHATFWLEVDSRSAAAAPESGGRGADDISKQATAAPAAPLDAMPSWTVRLDPSRIEARLRPPQATAQRGPCAPSADEALLDKKASSWAGRAS